MFPASLHLPAAIFLVAGGLLACFAGYRLFRLVLGIYGFILGALIATSIYGPGETLMVVLVALGGGLIGALVLIFAYFLGVALVGAALGALSLNLLWTQFAGEPHALVVILFAVLGALVALLLQRYVIIVGTAFGGAWTAVVGAFALMSERVLWGPGPWIFDRPFPVDVPVPGNQWVFIGWLVLGLAGTVVQLFSGVRPRPVRRSR
jgi:hypothetical protein